MLSRPLFVLLVYKFPPLYAHGDLKVMKRADSCMRRKAVKNMQCEKKLFKSHLHSSKSGKRVEKHATSTNQKMAASMESLLVRLLL